VLCAFVFLFGSTFRPKKLIIKWKVKKIETTIYGWFCVDNYVQNSPIGLHFSFFLRLLFVRMVGKDNIKSDLIDYLKERR
jgi:hypothetical protein